MEVPFRLQHPSASQLLFVLYVLHQQRTVTQSGLLCPGILLHCIYCISSVAFSSNGEHWQLQCMSSAHTCTRSLHRFCPDCPQIFHKDCFTCSVCQGWLEPGEEAAIKEDGLYCRKHKDVTGGLGEAAVHAVVTPECAQVWCACVCMRVCVCVCVCVHILYTHSSYYITLFTTASDDDSTKQENTKNEDKMSGKARVGKKPRQRTVLSEEQLQLLKYYYCK